MADAAATLLHRQRTSVNAVLPPRLEHRPALDGLRGLAVAAVVAFHLGYLQGGFLGVDLFFTLSGYLITRLLLDEHASTGTISLAAFWSRRAWRLLPAISVVVAAISAYAAFWATPSELADLRGAGIATLLFVANWWFIASDAGYWDQFVVPSPLEHVWSLAIEQQFYVIWPVVVVLVLRLRRSLDRLLAVTVVLVAASTSWLAILSRGDVSRAYFGSGSRFGSILVGAVLAILIHRQDPWLATAARSRLGPWIAGAAGVALAVAWMGVNGQADTWFYLGGYLAHAVAVAIVIAVLTFQTTGRAVRVLESAPLCRLGVISYGLYLWHWPVIVIINAERVGFGGTALLVLRLSLSLLLAEVSYRLVEVPARQRLAKKISPVVVFPLVAALVGGLVLLATRPPTSTAAASVPPPPPAITNTVTANTVTEKTVTENTLTGSAEAPEASLLVTIPAVLPPLRTPTVAEPLRVLLVGDSYMYDAQPGIVAALEAMQIEVVGAAQLGFAITGDGWEDVLRSNVVEHDPDLVIAMWARFDVQWLESNDLAEYQQRLDAATEILTADGALLGFIGLAPSLTAGVDREPVDRAINVAFADLPNRSDQAFYIDPDPIVAPTGEPQRRIQTDEGELLVRKVDVSHYCSDGSARFGLALSELVNRLTAIPVADPASWWLSAWRTDPRYDDPSGSCR